MSSEKLNDSNVNEESREKHSDPENKGKDVSDRERFQVLMAIYWEARKEARQESIPGGHESRDEGNEGISIATKKVLEFLESLPTLESLNLTTAEFKSISAYEEIGQGRLYFPDFGRNFTFVNPEKMPILDAEKFLQSFREWRSKLGVQDDELVGVIYGKSWNQERYFSSMEDMARYNGRVVREIRDGDRGLAAYKVGTKPRALTPEDMWTIYKIHPDYPKTKKSFRRPQRSQASEVE